MKTKGLKIDLYGIKKEMIVHQNEKTGEEVIAPLSILIDVLIKFTSLGIFLKFDLQHDKLVFFDKKQGIFKEITQDFLASMINSVIFEVADQRLSSEFVTKLAKSIKIAPEIGVEELNQDDRFLCFSNGLLDLLTGKRKEYSHNIVLFSQIKFDFPFGTLGTKIVENNMPYFVKYVKNLCDNNINAIYFIRSLFKAVFVRESHHKIFIVKGIGQTGKSLLGHILSSFVGRQKVVSTTLKALTTNQFETSALLDKTLVIFNDDKIESNFTDILKRLSGGDLIAARKKHSNKTFDFVFKGIILIITNSEPNFAIDESGAFTRRILILEANKTVLEEDKLNLLSIEGNKEPEGLLKEELGFMVLWSLTLPYSVMNSFLYKKAYIDSYASSNIEPSLHLICEFLLMFYEFDVEGQEPLGISRTGIKPNSIWANVLTFFIKKDINPSEINQKNISSHILAAAKMLNKHFVRPKRNSSGIFIIGIKKRKMQLNLSDVDELLYPIKPKQSPFQLEHSNLNQNQLFFLYSENQIGLDLPTSYKKILLGSDKSLKLLSDGSLVETGNVIGITENKSSDFVIFQKQYIPVIGDLRNQEPPYLSGFTESFDFAPAKAYNRLFEPTHQRINLNNLSKLVDLNIDHLISNIKKKNSFLSEEYLLTIKNNFLNYKNIISSNGLLVFHYQYAKQNRVGQRLFPENFGKTSHVLPKIIRENYFHLFSLKLKQKNKTVISLDIKSCYFNLILGLFPISLNHLSQYVKNGGLWENLETQFKLVNPNIKFSKKLAKASLYAALFGGKQQGLLNACLEADRKIFMISEQEHKNLAHYNDLKKVSEKFISIFMQTEIYQSLVKAREITKLQLRTIEEPNIVLGPAGDFFDLQNNFHKAFPGFMQEFELSILANVVLFLKKKFKIEPVMHLHDGIILIVEQDQITSILEEANFLLEPFKIILRLKNDYLGFDLEDFSETIFNHCLKIEEEQFNLEKEQESLTLTESLEFKPKTKKGKVVKKKEEN